jgi:hypothetical protein
MQLPMFFMMFQKAMATKGRGTAAVYRVKNGAPVLTRHTLNTHGMHTLEAMDE